MENVKESLIENLHLAAVNFWAHASKFHDAVQEVQACVGNEYEYGLLTGNLYGRYLLLERSLTTYRSVLSEADKVFCWDPALYEWYARLNVDMTNAVAAALGVVNYFVVNFQSRKDNHPETHQDVVALLDEYINYGVKNMQFFDKVARSIEQKEL